jgi:hypothetical protein
VIAPSKSAEAKPFAIGDEGWEGCSVLLELARGEAGKDRVMPVAEIDWSDLTPDDGLLVLHPEQPVSAEKLTNFLEAGGRIAVLDDYGAGDQILKRFHIHDIHIERVPVPAHPQASLRHNAELAIAEPIRDRGAGETRPSSDTIIEDVDRLITNHPTGLRGSPEMTPVLRIRSTEEPDVILALAANVGQGKLFAMGDPSAVINQMLRYRGNRAFAIGLIRYLVGNAARGSHRGRLFIVANEFTEKGTFPGAASSLKGEVEGWLRAMREAYRPLFGNGLSGPLGLGLAAALAFGLAAWVFSVASRTYRRSAPGFTRATPLVAQGGAAGRVAVLAAGSTPCALAMLELKSALEEGMGHDLGISGRASPTALLDAVRSKGALDERSQWALKEILLEMANVETLVVAGQAGRVKKSDVSRVARLVFGLLAMAKERLGKRTAA